MDDCVSVLIRAPGKAGRYRGTARVLSFPALGRVQLVNCLGLRIGGWRPLGHPSDRSTCSTASTGKAARRYWKAEVDLLGRGSADRAVDIKLPEDVRCVPRPSKRPRCVQEGTDRAGAVWRTPTTMARLTGIRRAGDPKSLSATMPPGASPVLRWPTGTWPPTRPTTPTSDLVLEAPAPPTGSPRPPATRRRRPASRLGRSPSSCPWNASVVPTRTGCRDCVARTWQTTATVSALLLQEELQAAIGIQLGQFLGRLEAILSCEESNAIVHVVSSPLRDRLGIVATRQ